MALDKTKVKNILDNEKADVESSAFGTSRLDKTKVRSILSGTTSTQSTPKTSASSPVKQSEQAQSNFASKAGTAVLGALAGIINRNPQTKVIGDAAVSLADKYLGVKDKAQNMETVEGYRDATLKDLPAAFTKGMYDTQFSNEVLFNEITGNDAPNKDALLEELAKEKYQYNPKNSIQQGIFGAAELLGQQAYNLSNPTTRNAALMGAGAGASAALVAGQLGPQALLPEEIITAPMGAVMGFKQGLQIGSAASNLKAEAGNAYQEMLELGISDKVARPVALAVGGANAAIEYAQMDELLNAYKVAENAGASKTVRSALLNAISRYANRVGEEATQEELQEAVSAYGAQAANYIDKGEAAYTKQDINSRIIDSGISSALSFAFSMGASGAMDMASSVAAAKEIASNNVSGNTERQTAPSKVARTPENPLPANTLSANEQNIQQGEKNAQPADFEDDFTNQRKAIVNKYASTLDGEGAKAMAENYDGLEDANDYIDDFTTFYNAGLNNGKAVYGEQKGVLNEKQMDAAFKAGMADRVLAMRKDESNNAQAGLAFETAPKNFNKTTARTVDTLAKKLGVRVVFGDSSINENGSYDSASKIITLNPNSTNPVLNIVKHEVTHRMQDLAPKQYQEFKDYVIEYQRAAGNLENLISGYLESYRKVNPNITRNEVLDEIVSDFTAELFTDDAAFTKLVNTNRTLAQKIYDFFAEIVNTVKGALNKSEVYQLNEFEKKWKNALNAAEKESKKLGANQAESGASTRHSLPVNLDSDYLKLANDPEANAAELQQMVDKKAESEGYSLKAYHGSRSKFTVFDLSKSGKASKESQLGFWFTQSRDFAENFANNIWYGDESAPVVYDTYVKLENPKIYESGTEEESIPYKARYDEASKAVKKAKQDIDETIKQLYKETKEVAVYGRKMSVTSMREGSIYAKMLFDTAFRSPDNPHLSELYSEYVTDEDRKVILDAANNLRKLSAEEAEAKNEYMTHRYNDAYEKLRTDIYKLSGQTAEDANFMGAGMMLKDLSAVSKFRENLISEGYDGIIIKGTKYDSELGTNEQFVVFNSDQIKLSDPVTYDDSGNIISLSQRFSENNPDIRYSIKTISNGTEYVKLDGNLMYDSQGNKLSYTEAFKKIDGMEITLPDGDVVKFVRNLPKIRVFKEILSRLPYYDGDIDIKQINDDINNSLIEVISSSKLSRWDEEDYAQRHKDSGIVSFDTRDVIIADNRSAYKLRISIANLEDGTKVGYAKKHVIEDKDLWQEIKKTERRTNMSTQTASVAESVKSDSSTTADSVSQNEANSNRKFSLPVNVDSDGNKLSAQQAEYFKNSKVRDKNGNLLVVYHGTPTGGFTVFKNDLSFFSTNKDYAQIYTNPSSSSRTSGKPITNQMVYEGYLNIEKPFDLNDKKVMDIFINEYVKGGYALGINPYQSDADIKKQIRDGIDWTEADNIKDFIDEMDYDYDGIILNEGGIPTDNGVVSRGLSYVTFTSNQFKNIDNENPTENPDIRYSIQSAADYQKRINALTRQNESLKNTAARLKNEITSETKITDADAKRIADTLLANYPAVGMTKKDLTDSILNAYRAYAKAKDENQAYIDLKKALGELAQNLVEDSGVITNPNYENYSELRSYLAKALRGDKKRMDSVYQDLMESYPEFFSTENITSEDAVIEMQGVLDNLRDKMIQNPFKGDEEMVAEYAANEIMALMLDAQSLTSSGQYAKLLKAGKKAKAEAVEKQRKADKAKLERVIADNKAKRDALIAKINEKNEAKIQKLMDSYKAKTKEGRERQNAKILRDRIMRHSKALSDKLLKPTDKKHIPEELRGAVAELLSSINLASNNNKATKRTAAADALRRTYTNILQEGTITVDPDMMQNLDEIAAMGDTPIGQLSIDQLETIWAVIRSTEAAIFSANKVLAESKYGTVSQLAEKLRADNAGKMSRSFSGLGAQIEKLVNTESLTPQAFFHELGDAGDELFKMMRKAQDKHITLINKFKDGISEITKDLDIAKLEKETHTFNLDGGTITLSTAQIMGLYELYRRPQAEEHIYIGGIRAGNLKKQGQKVSPELIKVSSGDIATITSVLSDEQYSDAKAAADKLQKYLANDVAEAANEASMQVYGYKKFTDPRYYPIKVDSNQIVSDVSDDVGKAIASVASIGAAKAVKQHARNGVIINSIFDVVSDNTNQMAKYSAWLGTMETLNKVRNYKFSDGNRTKTYIEGATGKAGNSYLFNLLNDVAQSGTTEDRAPTEWLVGAYKSSAVGANLRVILQQPTSYFRALAIMDAKYLEKGIAKKADFEKVKKYAPIAIWKDWGYFDINTGRDMKSVLFDSPSTLNKVNTALMQGAALMDSLTWAKLWNACEYEISDTTDLVYGSEDYYQAVAERFNEIIDKTQVVDGVLQRAGFMRKKDFLWRTASSFMAEPTKTLNMIRSAIYDYQNSKTLEARAEAKKIIGRTAFALTVSFVANAVAQSLVDAMRDDDEDQEYWEKFIENFIGIKDGKATFEDILASNFVGNFDPFSYLPLAKDFKSLLQGYDIRRMDMEALRGVINSYRLFENAMKGTGKYTAGYAAFNMLTEVSKLFGLPASNIKKDVLGIVYTMLQAVDRPDLRREIDKLIYNKK